MYRSFALILGLLAGLLPSPSGAQFSNGIISAAPGFIPDAISVKARGAQGNFCTFQGAVMTAGSPNITITGSCPLTQADVGKIIIISGAAGFSSPPLVSRINTVTSSTTAVTNNNASADTQNYYLTSTAELVVSGATGNYVPSDVMDCPATGVVGGAICKVKVYSTKVRAINSVTNAGTGSRGGTCFLKATNGTMFGQPTVVRFTSTLGGGITGAGTIISGGYFFTNPSTTTALDFVDANNDPATCGVTGVQLNVSIGTASLVIDTQGQYTAELVDPVTFGAGSISGATGASYNLAWSRTGAGGFGTNDGAAIMRAMQEAQASIAAGKPASVYFPAGNYLINGGSLPICTANCYYYGDGPLKSIITAGPSYVGADVFAFKDSWGGQDFPRVGPTLDSNFIRSGSVVRGLSVVGFLGVTTPVGAITFYGRTGQMQVDNFIAWFTGHCLRAGIIGGGTPVANVQESTITDVRCMVTGTSTVPAFQLTSETTPTFRVAAPNNNNIVNLQIYGSNGPGFVLDTNGAEVTNAGGNKLTNIRVEAITRSFGVGAGDLMRIGKAGEVAGITQTEAVNVRLIGTIADVTTPIYYCALRIAGTNTNNVDFKNLTFSAGAGGSNALCVDGGSSLNFDVNKFASQINDVTVASSTTVGDNITIAANNNFTKYSPYFWSINPTSLSSLYVPLIQNNTQLYQRTLPAGFPQFYANLTGNTSGTFPTSGLFGSVQGTLSATGAVTWPPTAKVIRIIAASQGGCGGGGGMGTLGTVVSGGGGGGGGFVTDRTYAAADLGASTTFTFGTPCVGGAGATVNGPGVAGGTGGTAGAGAPISWTTAAGLVQTVYGGGYGTGGAVAGPSNGGGSAGVAGAGNAEVGGAGAGSYQAGLAGGVGAAGVNAISTTVVGSVGGGGAGSSVTTGTVGGSSYSCPGGGSGGTLLAASASAGGTGGRTELTTYTVAGTSGGGNGGNAVARGPLLSGGSAPSGGGANTAGNGGDAGTALLVPCAGGAGGGAGTTRGGNGSAGGPAMIYYIAW